MMDGFQVGDKVRSKAKPENGIGEVIGIRPSGPVPVRVRWPDVICNYGPMVGFYKPKGLILVAEAVSGGEEVGAE